MHTSDNGTTDIKRITFYLEIEDGVIRTIRALFCQPPACLFYLLKKSDFPSVSQVKYQTILDFFLKEAVAC